MLLRMLAEALRGLVRRTGPWVTPDPGEAPRVELPPAEPIVSGVMHHPCPGAMELWRMWSDRPATAEGLVFSLGEARRAAARRAGHYLLCAPDGEPLVEFETVEGPRPACG